MTFNTPRIDWFRVIVDLERAGMSHRMIGKAIGLHRGTIWRLKDGTTAEPNYTPAQRLLALWAHKTGNPLDQPPTESVRNLDTRGGNTPATHPPANDQEPTHGKERPAGANPRGRPGANPDRALAAC